MTEEIPQPLAKRITDFLDAEDRGRTIAWLMIGGGVLFICGYCAGMHSGYHQALVDFGIIAGVTI